MDQATTTSEGERATVIEGPSFSVGQPDEAPVLLRTFCLSLRGVTAHVCTLGASLTQWRVPSCSTAGSSDDDDDDDDIVLGYKSPVEMYQTGNPTYLCVTVGRVANRIAKGRFQLENKDFVLAINNEPNHLHGGEQGFSRRLWNAEIVRDQTDNADAVKFSLTSKSGDQGYPGTVQCSASYSLKPCERGVSLHLELSATLQGDETTPINLAQHSYFNLARHDNPNGVLDHKLTLPCNFYTPLDETSIPTRQVKSLNDDATMDWREGRSIQEAMQDFALSKARLDKNLAVKAISNRSIDFKELGIPPFGFDHNYVVESSSSSRDKEGLWLVGTLVHEASQRTLRVRTSAPGVQLYTANFLGASDPAPCHCKDGATYLRWQGLCLETQAFPDSVCVDQDLHPDFYAGKCVILTPNNRTYSHKVVYDLDFETSSSLLSNKASATTFRGNDSEGNTYNSPEEMWLGQGVTANDKMNWYDRASTYYELNCPETIDGVLGGFANISDIDLEGSRNFVMELETLRSGWTWSSGAAAECGAGIGRVSKGLLLPLGVPRCDLVESSSRLLFAAPDYIGEDAGRCRFYCQGLQDWAPKKQSYSLIWVQWVFCYLTDDDAISFLRRCGEGLVDGGMIVMKENTCDDTDFVLDRQDASVTRSVPYLLKLIDKAGLSVVLQKFQSNFPSSIFPVPMIALEKRDAS